MFVLFDFLVHVHDLLKNIGSFTHTQVAATEVQVRQQATKRCDGEK